MRAHHVAALLLAVCSTAAGVQAQLTVTYVANEGFLLSDGRHKVLIDALFDDGLPEYGTIPDDMRPLLEQAREPFDEVDLVLVTHYHPDHFGPRAVTRHLQANPRAVLITTPQALGKLDERQRAELEASGRIRSVFPAEGQPQQIDVGDLSLSVLNLHHGRGRRPPVQNLGFLLRLGGVKVLHVGDTEATADDFRGYSLAEEKIDVAFLPSWFLSGERWIDVVETQIRPRRIVVMHLASPDAPASYFGSDGSYADSMKSLLRRFPEAIILDRAGASRVFAHRGQTMNHHKCDNS